MIAFLFYLESLVKDPETSSEFFEEILLKKRDKQFTQLR